MVTYLWGPIKAESLQVDGHLQHLKDKRRSRGEVRSKGKTLLNVARDQEGEN